MDVKAYCDSVGTELTTWKAKLYDVTRKTNALKGAHKEKAEPLVKELNALIDDIDQRIATLARECPSEWGTDKTDIDTKISQVKGKWKEVWGVLGESEYGIGGA
jgi:hypothetical protein